MNKQSSENTMLLFLRIMLCSLHLTPSQDASSSKHNQGQVSIQFRSLVNSRSYALSGIQKPLFVMKMVIEFLEQSERCHTYYMDLRNSKWKMKQQK